MYSTLLVHGTQLRLTFLLVQEQYEFVHRAVLDGLAAGLRRMKKVLVNVEAKSWISVIGVEA